MMVDAFRWSILQLFYPRVGGAGGEDPIVSRTENSVRRLRAECNLHAVFENDRCRVSGDGDCAIVQDACCGSGTDCGIGSLVIPAADTRVACGAIIARRVGRDQPTIDGGVENDEISLNILDLAEITGAGG